MKRVFLSILTLKLLFCFSIHLNAQSLFKDLNLGTNGSEPQQFININGTMYFITIMRPGYYHQLWKSDGTVAGTVIVKDSIINTNTSGIITFINLNNKLYYMLNTDGSSSSAKKTEMWKSDGTKSGTILVTTLTNVDPLKLTGDYPPQNYTVVGDKLFFQFGSGHGLELWVSDGTAAGTKEVVDLNPGNNGSGFYIGGVIQQPMIAYNGKVYFQGGTTVGMKELYSSDGTASGTTLILGGTNLSDPKNFIIYKNELFFQGKAVGADGIWKTDGTTGGTVNISNTGFNNDTKIFKNVMYYSVGGALWKSDGTSIGTSLVKDSVGSITGILDNYFYTSYMKYLPIAPYYTMYYWKSDGTTIGTERISNKIGKTASFTVLNNKMYNSVKDSVGYTSGLWQSDGTNSGTANLLKGYISNLYIYNSILFFSNFVSSSGYELWSLSLNPNSITESMNAEITIYPNPTNGIININWQGSKNATLQVLSLFGTEILNKTISNEIDISNFPKGIYFVRINDGVKVYSSKVVLQ